MSTHRVTPEETLADELARRGVSRRAFLKFGAYVGGLLALPAGAAAQVAEGLARARRRSVIWLSFQECTGCAESLTRSTSPTLEDLIFDFISLDYQHALMAVSGEAAERARREAMEANQGEYVVIVDGSIPLGNAGYSTVAGESNVQILEETLENAFAVVAMGTCAAFGGLPAAQPNPTGAVSVDHIVQGRKPLLNLSGCPPMPAVITGVLAHILVFGELPAVDHRKRPLAFFGETIHDRCYRRPFYEQGLFAETFDDEGARRGYCLYKVGCKGPVAYNACATLKWNGGVSFPIQSGHGCFACSEPNFWDAGGLYRPLPAGLGGFDLSVAGAAAGGVALGAAAGSLARLRKKTAADQRTFTTEDLEARRRREEGEE
jgi:hydrogenase small subunit